MTFAYDKKLISNALCSFICWKYKWYRNPGKLGWHKFGPESSFHINLGQ